MEVSGYEEKTIQAIQIDQFISSKFTCASSTFDKQLIHRLPGFFISLLRKNQSKIKELTHIPININAELRGGRRNCRHGIQDSFTIKGLFMGKLYNFV